MSKLVLCLLVAGAFLWALWIVLSRHAPPDPSSHSGWRRRFVLATLLFAAALGAGPACRSCYAMDVSWEAAAERSRDVIPILRAVWLTLDPARGEEFRRQIEPLVAQGRLQEPEGRMLAMAYAEIAFHWQRTRGSAQLVPCYEPSILGSTLYRSRETALKQVELLREAARKGTIDAETAAKARAALARELEMLSLAKDGAARSGEDESKLVKEYDQGLVQPTGPATAAATLIVGMEGGPMPDPVPGAAPPDGK